VVLRVFGGWTLARRLRTALAAFSLLLLVAVIVVVFVLRQADHALSEQTQRILPAREAASQLLTALVDQETGLRGYAITHKQIYLQPYQQGLANENTARARLERYVGHNDPARLDLLSVDAAITAWRQEYAELRLRDVLSGSATTTIEFGRVLFERVRATNAGLDTSLAKEAQAAQQKAKNDRRLVVIVLAALAVAVTAALVALQRGLRRVVLRPMRDLAGQVALVSQGQYEHVIEPAGPPDLHAMGEGVESMRLELVSALADVEERKRDLERRAAELARSNADLEQFAYVASHDLQEPLRKVASFCQLLEQRYGDQLDERGQQYIAFAVDGATRMQALINDLLAFSRVGRTTDRLVPVDTAASARHALDALAGAQEEAGAEVEFGDLPTVPGDDGLLTQVFQNLIGNGIKFRSPDRAAHIRLSAVREGDVWHFRCEDNGIGIDPQYADRIFVIFQRLHSKDEYGGTGIGLSLCKKIVEYHGGRIWLDTDRDGAPGTVVHWTLPVTAASVGSTTKDASNPEAVTAELRKVSR
jgi:signal transduction histidine kinase